MTPTLIIKGNEAQERSAEGKFRKNRLDDTHEVRGDTPYETDDVIRWRPRCTPNYQSARYHTARVQKCKLFYPDSRSA